MTDWKAKVPVPDSGSINSGLSPAHQATMKRLLGIPGKLTRECSDPSPHLSLSMTTSDVGPFRVTGHVKAVSSLKSILAEIKNHEPSLYEVLATEGMLCVRAVRGSTSSFSNHSWGTAIDIRVGTLDQYGSKKCASGLIRAYHFFHEAKWYWGAEFPRADSMHMEASDELIREWFG